MEYFRSLSLGLEVFIYPKKGYVQFIESSAVEICPENSISRVLLKGIRNLLDVTERVPLLMHIMRPVDLE